MQEALKQTEKVKVTAETFKNQEFRSLVMQRIEASFRFSGLMKSVALFGREFSYEAKSSKASMALYVVGLEGQSP